MRSASANMFEETPEARGRAWRARWILGTAEEKQHDSPEAVQVGEAADEGEAPRGRECRARREARNQTREADEGQARQQGPDDVPAKDGEVGGPADPLQGRRVPADQNRQGTPTNPNAVASKEAVPPSSWGGHASRS